MKTVRIKVYGDVIAVGFRHFVRENANKYNVKGYVRNTERAVEAVFEGREEDVNQMISLSEKGPRFGKVKDMEIKEIKYQGFHSFEIR